MLKAIRVSTLILLLACSAQAGYMQNGSPEPPPASAPTNPTPEPSVTSDETTTNGIIQNETASPVTQVALDVFAALSSLL